MSKEINFNAARIELFLESYRPPQDIRDQLDVGYSLENNVLQLFEIRPDWKEKEIIRHYAFVKARYIKSRNLWKIYWMPGSGKWLLYDPAPDVKTLDEVLEIVQEDKHHCFRG
jgi:hypothetical protein